MIFNSPTNKDWMNYFLKLNPSLRIDEIVSTIEKSIKAIPENSEKSEALAHLATQIQFLREEIYNPAFVKKVIYESDDSSIVTDEEVKNYLFSIVTPKKLQMLREWLIKGGSKVVSEVKVDVLIHDYTENLDLLLNEGSAMAIEIENFECNVPLNSFLNTIDKCVGFVIKNGVVPLRALSGDGVGPSMLEPILGQLIILRNEIFISNSTQLYTHKPGGTNEASDSEVKDYLFSMLSVEKRSVLNEWLHHSDGLFIEGNGNHKIRIITSIYVPDISTQRTS